MEKTVLITGGATGLGAELTRKFAEEKYNIIFTYLKSEEESLRLKEELISKYRVKVDAYRIDISDEENIKNLFSKIESIDVLINNAAINNDCNWNEKDALGFQQVLNTNVVGTYLMIKNATQMLKKTKGNIVNIASTNGIDTMYPESIDYDASKAGVINMTKTLAGILSPEIRVNAVAPGWIETKSTEDMNPNLKKKELEKIALGRFANCKEIAEVVYFIASSKASYINGSIIRVDGGQKYGI